MQGNVSWVIAWSTQAKNLNQHFERKQVTWRCIIGKFYCYKNITLHFKDSVLCPFHFILKKCAGTIEIWCFSSKPWWFALAHCDMKWVSSHEQCKRRNESTWPYKALLQHPIVRLNDHWTRDIVELLVWSKQCKSCISLSTQHFTLKHLHYQGWTLWTTSPSA